MLKGMLIKGGMIVAATVVAEVIIEKLEKRYLNVKRSNTTVEEVESERENIDKEWEKLK
jgi:hypothetical protein